ncbi:MAG: ATP-binding protein [Crocinitomicaceae bacterium]
MKKALLFLAFLIGFLSLHAQQKHIEPTVFDKTDGFKLSHVESIVADHDGFLWLAGSNDGLNEIVGTSEKLSLQRFNGTHFENFPLPESQGRVTLVQHLFKRTDGKFYVKAIADKQQVLFLFDPITTEFSDVNIPQKENLTHSFSPVHQFGGKNYILLQDGEEIGLYRFENDLTFARIYSFRYTERRFDLTNAKLIFSKKHIIISDDNIPIHAFDWQGRLIRKYAGNDFGLNAITSLSKLFIDEYYLEGDDCYFFLLENPQLFRLNMNDLKVKGIENARYPSDNLYILQGVNKTLMVSRFDETLEFRSANNQVLESININEQFGNVSIDRAFSRDLSKELWIVSGKQQLLHYSIEKKPISSALEDCAMRALFPLNPEQVLVATQSSGWFTLDLKTNRATPFELTVENKFFKPNSSQNIIPIDGKLWSASFTKIISIDLETKKIFKSKNQPISCLEKRTNSQLIYGSNGEGLFQYSIDTDKHELLLKVDSLDIIDLKVVDDWIIAGTDKGLLLYQFSTKKSQLFGESKSLKDTYILSVSNLAEGQFLLGTRSGHLYMFDVYSEEIKHIYEDELKAGIAGVLTDNENRLWISTFNGLVCFDPKTNSSIRYSTANGLSHSEANRYSKLKMGNALFFGSLRGLNYFQADQLQPEKDPAQLCLLMSEIFNENKNDFFASYNREMLNRKAHFTIPASQRSLKLILGVKHGRIGAPYTIKYRLNEDRWLTLDQLNTIYFPNLSPGNYALEVQLYDFSGKELGKSLSYTIKVEYFFYETGWFYLILLAIGLALIAWYISVQRKQRKMREKFSEELIEKQESERSRISKELHDGVGQQLTLIKKTAQNRDQSDLSELANSTLEEVRSISRNLHPPLLQELGLTASIQTLTNQLDERTDLFFTVELEDIDAFFDSVESLHIYRFIQEGLSNLIKHSKAKAAYIEICKDENQQVKIVVEDNGIGINNELKTFSLGLTTMQERIRILNGNFNIQAINPGTRIVAKIPVK